MHNAVVKLGNLYLQNHYFVADDYSSSARLAYYMQDMIYNGYNNKLTDLSPTSIAMQWNKLRGLMQCQHKCLQNHTK